MSCSSHAHPHGTTRRGHARVQAPGGDDTGPFSYEKDPMSWFFQNQIRSDAEFQERRKELQSKAKGEHRAGARDIFGQQFITLRWHLFLHAIMSTANAWPSMHGHPCVASGWAMQKVPWTQY